ncbi:TRAP-type C4-dicarboxylate transport system, substrate-binding protein [Bradyrhizobium lablabi]|uniref:TRAP-type C4-dicarboxylate transport system, substrate-binding protein n=1 Tax=Bradyrhizobium lablabi TaxID=722472 RepID=A0A1M6MRM6_9BRAD|nr:TRAP-type C4-dicarboxylate transport system, substrate-binding protein [Bradyrhizobium lablabi]
MRLFRMFVAVLLLLYPATALAQTVWDMPTEYPQSAMPGLGITTFATRLAELSSGKLQIKPSFDAAAGIRSAGMLTAIAAGRVQAGDAFAGALEAEDPIFALPSLPFLVTSIAEARRLSELARPYLAAALQKKGQRLLYLTPWPPTGIWSKIALNTASDLSGLSIRTYDNISSEVFANIGAKAATISFADTMPKLADGSINAVLSSGDGGAGRKLWEYLPYFTAINYSLPLSVASINQAVYDGLDRGLREAVDTAASQTETELWAALSTRLQENYARMRASGVTIDSNPAPAIVMAFHDGAAAAQSAWCARSGPVCPQILDAFNAGRP